MKLIGNPVSGGVYVGEIFIYESFDVDVVETFFDESLVDEMMDKYVAARNNAKTELEKISKTLKEQGSDKSEIFEAHLEILFDVAMDGEINDAIKKHFISPDWAIYSVYTKYADMLAALDDLVIQERAADINDVKKRLLRIWNGDEEKNLSQLDRDVIVAAKDLLPSDTATLDRSKVKAILTEVGGSTSHSAIIARSYGIPAILGIEDLLKTVKNGQKAAINAVTGEVELDPDQDTIAKFEKDRVKFLEDQHETEKYLDAMSTTKNGEKIEIGLNIASADEEELESSKYVDYVGLFRSEFLYMGKNELPTEEEQFEVYKNVLTKFGDSPVTLRTLDIGGDKTLQSMELPKEENPFLGNRALRLCFDHPEIFKTQIRAALRASVYGNLWLMLPMVGSIDDIRQAKAIIEEVKSGLDADKIEYNKNFKTGIMIEIPSIALIADLAAKEVDFASIGTNDLCQYTLAVDRMNPNVTKYYQSYNPAMFRLMGTAIKAFNDAGKAISVCGELGGEKLGAAVLVGLGLRKLSMGSSSIASIKRMLSELTIKDAESIAEKVCYMTTEEEIIKYLRQNIK